jgi:hypothetical protein
MRRLQTHYRSAAARLASQMIQRGIKVCWGDMACPDLPEGFTLFRHPNSFAIAKSSEGRAYIVALSPNRLVPIISREGNSTTCDFTKAISF